MRNRFPLDNQQPVPVMLLSQALGQGGSERQLVEIAKALDRSRFEVHVGYLRAGGFRIAELAEAGIATVHIPVHSFRSAAALRGAWQLRGYLRTHRIALAHAFDVPMNCFAVPVARACGTPVVLSSQRASRRLSARWEQAVLRFTDRLVNGTVVNCEFMARHMREDEGVAPERLKLCYNGLDSTRFSEGPRVKPAALAGASLVIGVVCALRPEKGLETLVAAFAKLVSGAYSDQRRGLRLAIVGSGPMLEPLRSLAEKTGIGSRCLFELSTQDVVPWLRGIDIFVLPSRSEALSNSLMEAMACGCAVVASEVGGNPELISEGITGLLFRPGDASHLAQQLERLADDADLRRALSTAAGERIRTRFSIQASVATMEDIYHTALLRKLKG